MIAYVEEVSAPQGRWLGVECNVDEPFMKHWLWGQSSRDEVIDRFASDTEVLDKKEFYLRLWRVFFLPRTGDPNASWETLVDLAGQDPTKRVVRMVSRPEPTARRGKSRIDHMMERNARARSGVPYTPPQAGGTYGRGRATKVPLEQVKTYTSKVDGSIWISPVNYAKVIGLPPQYVYQAVSKGKLRTKQGPKSKLISLLEADQYYRREVETDANVIGVGDQPREGSPGETGREAPGAEEG